MTSDERAPARLGCCDRALVNRVAGLFVKRLIEVRASTVPQPLYTAYGGIEHLSRLFGRKPAIKLTLDDFAEIRIHLREPLDGFVEVQQAVTAVFRHLQGLV